MTETLADRLAAFALATKFDDLPDAVVVEARRRLIDAFACAAGALDEPAPTIARKAARAVSGHPGAALFGGGRSSADWAAFANGVHIRYLDCNDTYLSLEPAHPSDNWAAIMAAGEIVGAEGSAWIVAAAVAYEVQCRLCDAASIRARGWDHVTYGRLSSAARGVEAVRPDARADGQRPRDRRDDLRGAPADEGGRALDVEGVRLRPRREERRLRRDPRPRGDDGARAALRRRHGLLPAGLRAVRAWRSSAGRRRATGCCRRRRSSSSRPSITASRRSRRRSRSGRRSATRVGSGVSTIETFKTAVEIIGQDPEKWAPRTRETADHSLPYCTAVALLDGEVSADQFTAERLAEPRLRDLVARTIVVEDPALTAGYPSGIPNRVTVTLDDGTTLVEEVAFPPGHDKNPLDDAGLARKFHGLVDPALGRERAAAIWERLGPDRGRPGAARGDQPARPQRSRRLNRAPNVAREMHEIQKSFDRAWRSGRF